MFPTSEGNFGDSWTEESMICSRTHQYLRVISSRSAKEETWWMYTTIVKQWPRLCTHRLYSLPCCHVVALTSHGLWRACMLHMAESSKKEFASIQRLSGYPGCFPWGLGNSRYTWSLPLEKPTYLCNQWRVTEIPRSSQLGTQWTCLLLNQRWDKPSKVSAVTQQDGAKELLENI